MMGYHPETLVYSFPGYRGPLQRLKPYIGFDIWHIDPERRSEGQRTDDSCGWFDRRPHEYADAVAYLLRDKTIMHEIDLILVRKVETLAPYYKGISERQISYPRLPAADTMALCLLVARELEVRRWWNGQDNKPGAANTFWRKRLTQKRHVDDLALDLALNPFDNLSSVDSAEEVIRLIAGALARNFKPWWKHPRWHIHHWRVNFDLPRNLRRMVQRCDHCGARLGFGRSPSIVGGKICHGDCAHAVIRAGANA